MAPDSVVPAVSKTYRVNNEEIVMVPGWIGAAGTDYQRSVLCCTQVTLNSARRRPLRQTGLLVIEGPVSSANWKLCHGEFLLLTVERRASWI
jgi:hypothetical protein